MPPAYDATREVRLGVVMYGGVSLAIYINGVAQELFNLVRATAPAAGVEVDGPLAEPEVSGTGAVYREVGRRLTGEDRWLSGDLGDAPVRTRFVVDILSGTSAGGINAIFLAKALALGGDIEQLKQLWIDEADIATLFNEPDSFKGLGSEMKFVKPPASLLNGPRLYFKALTALRAMGSRRPAGAPTYADEIDLAVTTTDLQGLQPPVRLADRDVHERRHRMVLRFRYASERAVGDGAHNDFADNDLLLAFAARATSSFPFAFEPVALRDIEAAQPKALAKLEARLARHFPDHARLAANAFEQFAFADGGYLDNKPFTHATETLRRRHAHLPVDRKLVYIEPDPAEPGGEDPLPEARPDALTNVFAALGLPRAETIREDVAAVVARNADIERVRRVTREVELAAVDPAVQVDPVGSELSPTRLAYLRLRRLEVLDDLAALVARTGGIDPLSEPGQVVRLLLDAWAPDGPGLTEFLDRYDLRYRMRRIALLQDRINDLLGGDAHAAGRLLAAARSPLSPTDALPVAGWLRSCKRDLAKVTADLRGAGRLARARTGSPFAEQAAALAGAARDLGGLLERHQPLAAAGEIVHRSRHADAVTAYARALEEHFGSLLPDADANVIAALSQPGPAPAEELSRVLVEYAGCSEAIDATYFPLVYPDLREVNPVEVFRVSPDDATTLRTGAVKALAGNRLAHFGGFLDATWRRHDLLWGRLDAADRLIAMLVPGAGERGPLVARAHAAILREELSGEDVGGLASIFDDGGVAVRRVLDEADDVLLGTFAVRYSGTCELAPDKALKLAGRGVAITGEVLDGTTALHRVPGQPLFWLSRVGRLLWGLAELAVPSGTLAHRLRRGWRALTLLLAVLLLVAGVLLDADQLRATGGALAAGLLAVTVTGWLMESRVRRRWLARLATVLAVLVVALAVVEVVRHGSDDLQALVDHLRDQLPLI